LFLVAAHLKDEGISRDMAIQLIEEHYNTPEHCEPCWNNGNDGDLADRLDVKVSNAYEYANLRRPGAHTTAAEFADDDDGDVSMWGPGYSINENSETIFTRTDPEFVKANTLWRRRQGWTFFEGQWVRRGRAKQW
jgi:hypothetical protein